MARETLPRQDARGPAGPLPSTRTGPLPLATLRLVCGAMLASLVGFGALAHVLPRVGVDLSASVQAPVLRIAWLGLALANVVMYLFLRRTLRRGAARRIEALDDHDARVEVVREAYALVTLAGSAMAEATGLFGVVIAALSGRPGDLWLALPPLLALLGLFPGVARLERFADALL